MTATLTTPRWALLSAPPDPSAWRAVAKYRAALWRDHERRCRVCRSGHPCGVERELHAATVDAECQWDLAERRLARAR